MLRVLLGLEGGFVGDVFVGIFQMGVAEVPVVFVEIVVSTLLLLLLVLLLVLLFCGSFFPFLSLGSTWFIWMVPRFQGRIGGWAGGFSWVTVVDVAVVVDVVVVVDG